MDKKQLIDRINNHFEGKLNNRNTCYSNINVAKAVWWLNVSVSKFQGEVHLLLADKDHALWISLPKGFVSNLSHTFKIREDKNAVDLEISSDKKSRFLKDIKSGGTGFDFSRFVKQKIDY